MLTCRYVPYSKSQSQRTVPDRTSYTHEQRRNMADANLQETIFGNGKLMEDAACPKQSLKPVANNDPLIEKFRFRHNRTESLAFTECPKRVLPKKPMVVCFLSNCRMVSTSPDSPSDFSAVRSSGPPPDKRQDLRAGRRQVQWLSFMVYGSLLALKAWFPDYKNAARHQFCLPYRLGTSCKYKSPSRAVCPSQDYHGLSQALLFQSLIGIITASEIVPYVFTPVLLGYGTIYQVGHSNLRLFSRLPTPQRANAGHKWKCGVVLYRFSLKQLIQILVIQLACCIPLSKQKMSPSLY